MQATESDERYPRLIIFNVLEGQTERFVANIVQFLRNSPFPVNCTHFTTFHLCKITTANGIQKMPPSGPALSIVQYVGK